MRGLQDEEEEHEALHAVPASQDSGGPPQAVLPHRAVPTEAQLNRHLPALRPQLIPLH